MLTLPPTPGPPLHTTRRKTGAQRLLGARGGTWHLHAPEPRAGEDGRTPVTAPPGARHVGGTCLQRAGGKCAHL